MTRTIALVVVVWLCVACCASRRLREPPTEAPPNTAVLQDGQGEGGGASGPLYRGAAVTPGWPSEHVKKAEKKLQKAQKAAQSNLVSARNSFAMEVLHNRSQVEVVEAEEKRMRQEEEAELERRRNMEAHRRAGVLALDDGSLLARMFRGDKDMGVLLQLPGAHTLMTKYRDNFNAVCERVFREGLEHEDQRQTELRLLRAALRDARTRADVHARGAVRELEAEVGEVAQAGRELQQAEEASLGDDQGAHEARVSEAAALHEKIDGLLNKTSYDLLTAEVTLSDQIKDVVARAREELGSLVGGFLEEAAAEFQEGRRLAYAFYCRLRELSTKVADECTSVEEQERTARVFEGSDTLQAALAGIHDRHLALIDAREADLREHLQCWLANTLQQIQEEEWARHRARVEEITTLTARQRQLLYEALPPLQE